MFKTNTQLTESECIRLNEILFYKFVIRIMDLQADPTKVLNFIEIICSLTDCSPLIINGVVSLIMCGDRHYIPRFEEEIHLRNKAGIPVRKTCKELKMSQRTYYKALDAYRTKFVDGPEPKFNPMQHPEIIKFLDGLDTFIV